MLGQSPERPPYASVGQPGTAAPQGRLDRPPQGTVTQTPPTPKGDTNYAGRAVHRRRQPAERRVLAHHRGCDSVLGPDIRKLSETPHWGYFERASRA